MAKLNEAINELFICQCNNIKHQLIFSYNKDWDEVFVFVHLIPIHNIWKRIWIAITYIFGYKSCYGHFDEFIFKKSDADKFQKIIDYLRND